MEKQREIDKFLANVDIFQFLIVLYYVTMLIFFSILNPVFLLQKHCLDE